MTRTEGDHNAKDSTKPSGIPNIPSSVASSHETSNSYPIAMHSLCYPRGCKISGPFIIAAEWSEENYCFLFFIALVRPQDVQLKNQCQMAQ
jgi:hypothetical protein